MKKAIFFLTLIIAFISCEENDRIIESIEFKRDYMFTSKIKAKIANDTVPWKHQISASSYAIKGDYKNALTEWDLAMGGRDNKYSKPQIDSINLKYSQTKAKDYIINQAKKNQVIIINEAHHNSFHRFFTKSLLEELYKLGYTHLGLEALSSGKFTDTLLNERAYPVEKTGYYIKDPQFGSLIRAAINIGYNVFPYEQTNNSNGKPREIEQAKNIQKVIQDNPNGKFLIHCGFDHALEGNHKSWDKAMAGRLNEFTGINPLTINQVIYSEKGNYKFNHPLLKALDIKKSSVILDQNGNPLGYNRGEAFTDIAVFHPNTKYINNRPDWLFNKSNKNVSIELADIQIEFPIMVLAFKKGEDINIAIPVDITEIDNVTNKCHLALEKGIYQIVVTNGDTSFKFEQKVK